MVNTSWGTKRNCPSCNTHFYDLNKTPAVCPKCKHEFDPGAIVRAKRKAVRREAPESKAVMPSTVLAQKKPARKKDSKADGDAGGDGDIGDIAEIEDVDDIENLQDLSELEEMEENTKSEDDADDEAIIEDLGAQGKVLVGNVEEEEADALVKEIEDEEDPAVKKAKLKKKPK